MSCVFGYQAVKRDEKHGRQTVGTTRKESGMGWIKKSKYFIQVNVYIKKLVINLGQPV
jgi:hypothetical protein